MEIKKTEDVYMALYQPLPNEELIMHILQAGMELKYKIFLSMDNRYYCRGSQAIDEVIDMVAKTTLELAEVTVTKKRICKIKDLLGVFSYEDAEMGLDEQNGEVFKLLVEYYDKDNLNHK